MENPEHLKGKGLDALAPAEEADAETWDSCCMRIDRRATVYFTQLSISFIIMFFCIYQLLRYEDCDSRNFYSSLLTLVIGMYVPSPAIH